VARAQRSASRYGDGALWFVNADPDARLLDLDDRRHHVLVDGGVVEGEFFVGQLLAPGKIPERALRVRLAVAAQGRPARRLADRLRDAREQAPTLRLQLGDRCVQLRDAPEAGVSCVDL
ncbi:hypothetical protein LTR94_034570, partial [Friedmanniomyces endolithicus]